MKECKSVVSNLGLSSIDFNDEFMQYLAGYVQNNQYLEDLSLSFNNVSDKSIEILSESLIGNTTLKKLNFHSNRKITTASIPHLLEIANQSGIISLTLSDTSISQEKQEEINELLKIPIDQRQIPLKSKSKSAAKKSVSAST